MDGRVPTIVMFSRGRPQRLLRQFAYHAGYPGRLVVVDGSEEPLPPVRLPGNAEYHHLPGATIYRRVAAGIARVESEACCLAADDDYVVHGGLVECGRAIEADSRVSCAAGTIVHFVTGERSAARAVADGAVERVADLRDEPTPAARFRSFIRLEPQIFYSCLRTSTARRVTEAVADLPDGEALVGEQLWNALPSLFGHVRMVPRLQVCRRMQDRDYGWYLAPFRAIEDIAEWPGFPAMSDRLRALAREAGADGAGAAAVVEAWREFAAATGRGRRNWRKRRLGWRARARRIARNALSAAGVAVIPPAWFDGVARRIAADVASRPTLRARAYPWCDPVAQADYERIMAFDAQAPARA
jgi:glycosyltransferase domain-containing protein